MKKFLVPMVSVVVLLSWAGESFAQLEGGGEADKQAMALAARNKANDDYFAALAKYTGAGELAKATADSYNAILAAYQAKMDKMTENDKVLVGGYLGTAFSKRSSAAILLTQAEVDRLAAFNNLAAANEAFQNGQWDACINFSGASSVRSVAVNLGCDGANLLLLDALFGYLEPAGLILSKY